MRTTTALFLIAIACFMTVGYSRKIRNLLNSSGSETQSQYYYPSGGQKYFIAKPCITYHFTGKCPSPSTPGCACYTDGHCEYKYNGNACSWCKKNGVASFNPGEGCPNIGNKKLKVCTNTDPVRCTSSSPNSNVCECDQHGSCNYVQDDSCNACNRKGVVSALNGQCSLLKM